jgi:hypothetical protein
MHHRLDRRPGAAGVLLEAARSTGSKARFVKVWENFERYARAVVGGPDLEAL